MLLHSFLRSERNLKCITTKLWFLLHSFVKNSIKTCFFTLLLLRLYISLVVVCSGRYKSHTDQDYQKTALFPITWINMYKTTKSGRCLGKSLKSGMLLFIQYPWHLYIAYNLRWSFSFIAVQHSNVESVCFLITFHHFN